MKKVSLKKKLYFFAFIYVAAILAIAMLAKFGMDNLIALRSFVGAESIYMKDTRNVADSLRRYIITHNIADYHDCIRFISKIHGCRDARLELEKTSPDYQVAYKNFTYGGNHPADVKGMAAMLKRFGKFGLVAKAVDIWKKGDMLIDKLEKLNRKANDDISEGRHAQGNRTEEDMVLLDQVNSIDNEIMLLGNDFARLLGDVSRWAGALIVRLMFVGAILVALVGMIFIIKFVNNLMRRVDAFILASRKIGEGDFSVRCDAEGGDEISTLACSFNHMATELKDAQEKSIRQERLAVLGKLSGAVGHELRNPLAAIKNAVYYLKAKMIGVSCDPKINEYLDILDEEVSISNRIITDILTFGRLKEPEYENVNIVSLLESVLSRLKVPANIKLSMEPENNLPQIMADGEELRQVFSNIIINAIQAMSSGGTLKICVVVQNKENDGKWMSISFSDTGVGISKENISKIFEPLFSSKVQGTGLGLTICQSIISLHKGSIEVESPVAAYGSGAKFTVNLPMNNKGV